MKYITKHNPDWPNHFKQIAAYLKPFLPDNCTLHHIGSTSIPGMPAKGIIDLDIEYRGNHLQAIIENLRKAGYEHAGDLGIPGREAFTPISASNAASLPPHHLYACESGAYELNRHLVFRDYLLAHPERATWLADQKRLANATASSKSEYIENKSSCYEQITKESLVWCQNTL